MRCGARSIITMAGDHTTLTTFPTEQDQADTTAGTPPRREQARLWQDAALGNLELLHAQFFAQSFSAHTHETYAIGLIEHGADQFDYRGRRETAHAGAITIIHPGELHTGGPLNEDGWRYRAFYPTAGYVSQLLELLGSRHRDPPFFRSAVIYDPTLFGQLQRMHIATQDDATSLERESRLMWSLASLIKRHGVLGHTPHLRAGTPGRCQHDGFSARQSDPKCDAARVVASDRV